MKLLREFVRESLTSMFGLGRSVTINALQDVVGGPDPQPIITYMQQRPDASLESIDSHSLMSSITNEFDDLNDDVDKL